MDPKTHGPEFLGPFRIEMSIVIITLGTASKVGKRPSINAKKSSRIPRSSSDKLYYVQGKFNYCLEIVFWKFCRDEIFER